MLLFCMKSEIIVYFFHLFRSYFILFYKILYFYTSRCSNFVCVCVWQRRDFTHGPAEGEVW